MENHNSPTSVLKSADERFVFAAPHSENTNCHVSVKKKCKHVELFCSTTTCHGLPHIANRDDHLYFRIGWVFVVMFFVFVAGQSVFYSVKDLFDFQLTSEFLERTDETGNQGMLLPDIHLCDSSIFNATRLAEMGFNDTMATYLTLATSENAYTVALEENVARQQELKEEFDRILDNASWTMKDVIDLATIKCEEMLIGCSYEGEWVSAEECCEKYFAPQEYVSTFGSCVTTHGKRLVQLYTSRDAGFVVYAIPNTRHVINFDHTLIKPEYIMQEGLYYAVSRPAMNIESTLHTEGRYALPNSWVSNPITKSMVDNSELQNNILAPYTCVNSDDPVYRDQKTPDYLYYSETNCHFSVYQRNYRRFYNCSTVFSNYGNYTSICDPSQIMGADLGLIFSEDPSVTCPVECITEHFSLAPSYAQINKGILLRKYDNSKNLETDAHAGPVVLHFFYTTFTYQVRKSHTTTLTNFLGEVGGNLGLCLGISFVTIVEFLVLCVRCFAD